MAVAIKCGHVEGICENCGDWIYDDDYIDAEYLSNFKLIHAGCLDDPHDIDFTIYT